MPPEEETQVEKRCFVVLDGKETAIELFDFCMTHDVPQSDFSELDEDEEPYVPTLKPITAEITISRKEMCRVINRALRNINRAAWRPRHLRRIQILRFWILRGRRYLKIKDRIFARDL